MTLFKVGDQVRMTSKTSHCWDPSKADERKKQYTNKINDRGYFNYFEHDDIGTILKIQTDTETVMPWKQVIKHKPSTWILVDFKEKSPRMIWPSQIEVIK
jgi:hypothetical protein